MMIDDDDTLRRLKDYREANPEFQQAIDAFVDAETLGLRDPVEGEIIADRHQSHSWVQMVIHPEGEKFLLRREAGPPEPLAPGIWYGTLQALTWDLPFATAEEQQEADEATLGYGGLCRVFRGATDWGFEPRDHSAILLPSGALVKVFKSVTDGDIGWQGEIDFITDEFGQVVQKDVSPKAWFTMFHDEKPARLERDGQITFGSLAPSVRESTQEVLWTLHAYGVAGEEGMTVLQNHDRLTVYDTVRDGAVEWEGKLAFGPERVSDLGSREIMREARHVGTKNWLNLSFERRPAILVIPSVSQP